MSTELRMCVKCLSAMKVKQRKKGFKMLSKNQEKLELTVEKGISSKENLPVGIL